jgi:hypothetical protein
MGKNPGKEILKTVWPMNKEQMMQESFVDRTHKISRRL